MEKIKFYSLIPEIVKDTPIVKASQIKFDWVKCAKDYYNNEGKQEVKKTTKCPGIFSLLSLGWIQCTYQDITIETNGDMYSFNWHTPINQINLDGGNRMHDYVSYHSSQQLAVFKQLPKNTLHTLIKIQSPWFVQIPQGYSLLLAPLPYSDDNRFTAATGLLRGENFINVQLYWHVLKGKETIKKGTPLHQMLLIKDHDVDLELEDVKDHALFERQVLKPFFDNARKRFVNR